MLIFFQTIVIVIVIHGVYGSLVVLIWLMIKSMLDAFGTKNMPDSKIKC